MLWLNQLLSIFNETGSISGDVSYNVRNNRVYWCYATIMNLSINKKQFLKQTQQPCIRAPHNLDFEWFLHAHISVAPKQKCNVTAIKNTYKQFDKKGEDKMKISDLSAAMKAVGHSCKSEFLEKMEDFIDTDGIDLLLTDWLINW